MDKNNNEHDWIMSIEEESNSLLREAKATMEQMNSTYYPEILKNNNRDSLKPEVEKRKESLKRARKNVLKSYQILFDISEELAGRWADLEASYTKRGRKKRKVNAEIDYMESMTNHFSRGISIYKILLLIFIGSFAGVIIEMLWCLLRHGYIESRQGLIYGLLNPLYGVGAALLSVFLYRYRNFSSWISFLGAMLVGSLLEYACSWGQEVLIGSRSWDYSSVPFNINGRICLLYSIFWGMLGVLWIKRIYPIISNWILKIPNMIGKTLTWIFLVFYLLDCLITLSALYRWSERQQGLESKNRLEVVIDEKYPDERMERVFPNMVFNEY